MQKSASPPLEFWAETEKKTGLKGSKRRVLSFFGKRREEAGEKLHEPYPPGETRKEEEEEEEGL